MKAKRIKLTLPFRPFGGIRESGWGKEGGSEGMSDFCIQKMVCIGSTSAMA
jgi:acyl-CoA reductase-like NAD-dependent aldehyde dehydrogenase